MLPVVAICFLHSGLSLGHRREQPVTVGMREKGKRLVSLSLVSNEFLSLKL